MENKTPIVTSDLKYFGGLEFNQLNRLITARMESGLPLGFYTEGITFMLNTRTGYVFFTNEDYQVAMINDETNKLEMVYSCPECGEEGFYDDILEYGSHCCKEYIKEETSERHGLAYANG